MQVAQNVPTMVFRKLRFRKFFFQLGVVFSAGCDERISRKNINKAYYTVIVIKADWTKFFVEKLLGTYKKFSKFAKIF